jgi:hypothetical protein
MKNLLVALFAVMFSFVSYSQTIEVEFKNHLGFNSGKYSSYEDVIKEENMLVKEFRSGGTNKYVIYLDTKKIMLFYNDKLIETETVIDYQVKKGLIFITFNDVELVNGEPVNSYIVINQNKKDKKHPKFTFYFISKADGSSNGYKSID